MSEDTKKHIQILLKKNLYPAKIPATDCFVLHKKSSTVKTPHDNFLTVEGPYGKIGLRWNVFTAQCPYIKKALGKNTHAKIPAVKKPVIS